MLMHMAVSLESCGDESMEGIAALEMSKVTDSPYARLSNDQLLISILESCSTVSGLRGDDHGKAARWVFRTLVQGVLDGYHHIEQPRGSGGKHIVGDLEPKLVELFRRSGRGINSSRQ